MQKFLVNLIFLLLISSCSPACAEVVFNLDFNNGLTAKDAKGKSIEPVKAESVKFADSRYGKSLRADNRKMRLIYPASVIPAQAGTIEILLSAMGDKPGSRLDFCRGIEPAKGATSSPHFWLWKGKLRLDVAGSLRGQKSYICAGRPEWKKGKWNLLTGTWDRKTGRQRLFINGKLMRSDLISPWYLKQLTDLTIGYGQKGSRVFPANAKIATVNIFDKALTAGQIEQRARRMGILPPLTNGPVPHSKWKNSLAPKGKIGDELTLASDGNTDYTILISSSVKSQNEKAAIDLAAWLRLISGATFEIKSEKDFKGKGPVISIGRTEYLKTHGIAAADKKLTRDGYAIAIKGKDLFLWGSKQGRGTLNSVYAFLEEDLGCRWYADSSVMVDKRVILKCHPVSRVYEPVLEVRNPHYYEAFDAVWSIRNRTSASPARVPAEYGGQLDYAPGYWVHTFERLMPVKQYYEQHPEYYSSIPGRMGTRQLCMTNPDVLKIVTRKVRNVLRKNPDALLISIDPNDGIGYCECEKCKDIFNREGKTHAAALLQFVNGVADGIKRDYPNVKVVTLAYLDTLVPPRTIRPRENVIIRLCTDQHAWSHQFKFVTETKKFSNAMKAWSDIGAKIHIWDYTINFQHYLTPMPNMPVVTDNIRWMIDHNAKGIMLQGDTQGVGASRAAMRCWVWGKQLMNPELDTRELMDDFIYGYYGHAAEPIKEYNDMLWKLWEYEHKRAFRNQGCGLAPTSPVFSRKFIKKATELFDKAEELAKEPKTLKRVRRARIPLLYMKLSRGKDYLPGENYLVLCDKFEAIAKAENIRVLKEENKFRGQNHIPQRVALWRGMADLGNSKIQTIPVGKFARFKTDPKKLGEKQKWFAVNHPDRDWGGVNCGYFWDMAGYKNFVGVAWYRISFNYPENFAKGRKVRILFGGVDEECEIWINGKKAFEHTVKSTGLPLEKIWKKPFLFDPTPYLKAGENVMTVKVINAAKAGGIWKPIYLVAVSTEREPVPEALLKTIKSQKKKSK